MRVCESFAISDMDVLSKLRPNGAECCVTRRLPYSAHELCGQLLHRVRVSGGVQACRVGLCGHGGDVHGRLHGHVWIRAWISTCMSIYEVYKKLALPALGA